MDTIRVRFAPSPTGHLHIGSVRVAIFNWLFARHHNGVFLLRIEDTDIERSKKEYTDSILASLAWARIDWDEPYVIQTENITVHKQVIEKLLAEGKAYRCYCTHEEIVARHPEVTTIEGEAYRKYDGFCRNRTHDISKPAAIRFKIPADVSTIEFDDLVRGNISISVDQLDDFIIARSDGSPMYNFVVVVDDATMKISHVIRGEDHISNTPKQILLYQACGYAIPKFAHLPMILGADGNRLSKRDAATSVFEYKEKGYLPEALINYLVRLGWAHGDQEIFTKEELISFFSLEHVGKKGAIFDQDKLDWVNGVYMRNTPDERLLEIIVQDIRPTFLTDLPRWDQSQVERLIGIYKQRAKTLLELVHDITALYKAPTQFARADITEWFTATTLDALKEVVPLFQNAQNFTHDALTQLLKDFCKTKNIKLVTLAQPLRIALIGKTSGPGVFDLLEVIGKTEALDRISRCINAVSTNTMIE